MILRAPRGLGDAVKRGLDESSSPFHISFIFLAGDGLRAQMAEISPPS
jgi:hypothetical protein